MSSWGNRFPLLLVLFAIISFPLLAGLSSPIARSLTTGLVCVDMSSSTTCPASPATLSGNLNSTIIVNINIQGSEALNGLDVTVSTDDQVLRGTSISTIGSVLGASPFVLTNCVDGRGSGCAANDGPGTAHLAAVDLGGPTASPITGQLFSITYVVVGNSTGTTIGFLTGCSGTTSVPNICVTIANPNPVPESIQTAIFSNTPSTPDFSLSATPTFLSVQPSNSSFSTITIASLGGFTGDVFLNVNLTSFAGNATQTPVGVKATLNPQTVSLLHYMIQNSTLTFTVLFNATLGTYGFSLEGSSGSLTHFVMFTVRVGSTQTLGFPFHDDFNYSSLDQLFATGWTACGLGPPSYHSVGGGALTVTNDGTVSGDVCLPAPPGLSNWSYSARIAWVGGSVGGLEFVVFTKLHAYAWIADNFYHRYHLLRDTTDVFSTDGFQSQLNVFHDLRLDAVNGLISVFFDGGLMGTYQEQDPTISVNLDLSAAWNTMLSYDSADGAIPPPAPPDFAISANPPSLTFQAGSSGTSQITLTSSDGFAGSVQLASQVSPALGPTSSLSPSAVSLSPNGTASATLLVSSSTFDPIGPFSVTVTGSSGTMIHSTSINLIITPPPPPPPDFGIEVFPQSIVLLDGGSTTATVSVFGFQGFTGNVQLGSSIVPGLTNGPNISLNPSFAFVSLSQSSGNAHLTVSTLSSTAVGNYTITVTGTSGSLTHAATVQLVILPPPTLAVSPSNGTLGTQIMVQGHGFPPLPPGLIGVSPILVSFDDQFIGFAIPTQGSFNFTFNVPHAQTGLHHIKALDEFTRATATADFQVIAPPAVTITASMDTGTIYSPGDSATIYISTQAGGAPATPSSIQLALYLPNGTSTTLPTTAISTGLSKATYLIPKTASIGTYALLATVEINGVQASSLRTFEVKSPWVSPGGPTSLATLGLPDSIPSVALIGMVIAGIAVAGLAFLIRKTPR